MKHIMLLFSVIFVFSCENNSFDKDKRQLIAKREIREKLPDIQSFDLKSFKEDTLHNWKDSLFKDPIRYSFDVEYTDPAGIVQNKQAFVLFTSDGKSVITSQINN